MVKNDYSNKKQLGIILIAIILITAILIFYINYRPQIQRLEDIPVAITFIQKDISGIYDLVKKLAESDSTMKVQLNHFPSTPLRIEDMSKVSSSFNNRIDPVTGVRQFHTGIDYQAKRGTIVYAAATGIVTEAKWDGGYGNAIQINHENGYITKYAHLSNMTVIAGDSINKGDTIGNVGNTGKTTGVHLHYEILYADKRINPEVFIQTAR